MKVTEIETISGGHSIKIGEIKLILCEGTDRIHLGESIDESINLLEALIIGLKDAKSINDKYPKK